MCTVCNVVCILVSGKPTALHCQYCLLHPFCFGFVCMCNSLTFSNNLFHSFVHKCNRISRPIVRSFKYTQCVRCQFWHPSHLPFQSVCIRKQFSMVPSRSTVKTEVLKIGRARRTCVNISKIKFLASKFLYIVQYTRFWKITVWSFYSSAPAFCYI